MFLLFGTCWFHKMLTLPSICFDWLRYMVRTVFNVQYYPYFLAYVKVQFSTCSIMSLYILTFCQYWACRYDELHCLIKLHVLFMFVIFLSHDISFVMPDLVLLLFHFHFFCQISPRQPQEHVFISYKLSNLTSNTQAMHYFLFPFFL